MCNSALTETSLFNLFRRQSKHRKQLDHYLDNYLRQYRSGRNRRINLQTLEEVPQTLEQLEKSIITGCDPTSGLEYSFVTGESVEKRIQGTYYKESIDSREQGVCWLERDLKKSLKELQGRHV
jgi:hypothetical protein